MANDHDRFRLCPQPTAASTASGVASGRNSGNVLCFLARQRARFVGPLGRADKHLALLRQIAVEPERHPLRLALTFDRQFALEVILSGLCVMRLRVTPENDFTSWLLGVVWFDR